MKVMCCTINRLPFLKNCNPVFQKGRNRCAYTCVVAFKLQCFKNVKTGIPPVKKLTDWMNSCLLALLHVTAGTKLNQQLNLQTENITFVYLQLTCDMADRQKNDSFISNNILLPTYYFQNINMYNFQSKKRF